MKVTSFRQCTQCPTPSVGIFAEWAAFAVEDVKGYALLDTGASRSVGGYMMVQCVIDCLSRNTAPPWLESADPAVSFTFAGGEKAHSETRIWLPLPGTRHERFAVHIVPSEVTPILLGLDMLREFGLVINADSAHCYSTKLRCRIPVTVLPSGHLALALTPSGSFETTEETKTLVKETAADMTAAVQEDFLEQGQHPVVAGDESNDADTKQVPRVPGSVIRDLLAAARQMDETMVSAFKAACSFRRLDLALVNHRRRMVRWGFDNCARCTETQRLDCDEESTNRMVLLSDSKQHAVRK